ncbi:MAG: hypothetical protein A2991_01105 [Candidatus Terrybacteria bacterium RIFCSPLOWO2_01_FULL_58_14]|uniref:Uncharacterized protein n=2 Tax=Candidatus Terryibacteriota TaxID=1817920 RepID=A0A1G2PVG2_9BACT|nr:MAG: hypothetical protein A2682_01650 [Candidatus Terrybacteria bacterium RIFCSPHIGHO2_01_FULL_58_15]OHA52305.1 MAG: hypothetical protein A2991_01105 [Candidatus Terrybacteria bacterium RIFCSPLOWO2_01_FULL_58_14]
MIVEERIENNDLVSPFTKAVVDIERGILAVGCELHVDCAEELAQSGSRGGGLWGFNIYPDGRLEFVSLINIRPKAGNRSMEIQDAKLREQITEIVRRFLPQAHA